MKEFKDTTKAEQEYGAQLCDLAYLPHEIWTSRKGSEQLVDKINELVRLVNSLNHAVEPVFRTAQSVEMEPVRE